MKNENFIASHLLKAVHFWTDSGFGKYGLYFIRDKLKREVDFLVVKDNEPYFMVEVKSSGNQDLSPNLKHFSTVLGVKHAFQVEVEAEYVDADCFKATAPIRVPAATFLSQLV